MIIACGDEGFLYIAHLNGSSLIIYGDIVIHMLMLKSRSGDMSRLSTHSLCANRHGDFTSINVGSPEMVC